MGDVQGLFNQVSDIGSDRYMELYVIFTRNKTGVLIIKLCYLLELYECIWSGLMQNETMHLILDIN